MRSGFLRALTLEGERDPGDGAGAPSLARTQLFDRCAVAGRTRHGAAITAIEEVPDVPMEALSPEPSVPNPAVPMTKTRV
jgi:hypothetical protein